MRASLEWLCEHAGIVRVHPDPDGDWTKKSSYTLAFTVKRLAADTVLVLGFSRRMTWPEARALHRGMKREGLKWRRDR